MAMLLVGERSGIVEKPCLLAAVDDVETLDLTPPLET